MFPFVDIAPLFIHSPADGHLSSLPFGATVSPLHTNIQVVCNFQRCERAPVCQLLYCTTALFKVLYCKIKNVFLGFPGGAVVENLPANAGDTGSSPGLGRSHMPRGN